MANLLPVEINDRNVGRIAERIVANELEAHGFRVTDLNKDGLSANADLLASGRGATWQVQVKGATQAPKDRWWVGYGHCTNEIIDRKAPMFNRRNSFYKADVVVLVAIKSLTDYLCIVLPIDKAEEAAQLNLDCHYRTPKRSGGRKKPHKVYGRYTPRPREDRMSPEAIRLTEMERAILKDHANAWHILHK